jgi:hypothetical protein
MKRFPDKIKKRVRTSIDLKGAMNKLFL